MTPQPAYLLHKRPYRETSALVELLTLEHGRVRAVAQGVQRAGSKSRGRLQPFAALHVTWQGDHELKRLRLLESRGSVSLLAGEGLLCGLYANELLTRLLPPLLPAPDVFAYYTAALDALTVPAQRAGALRRLEISLLEVLDSEPVFLDSGDRALDPQSRYVYLPEQRRFAPTESDRGMDGRGLRLLAGGDWERPGLAGLAKALTRSALDPLLGERSLRSRELMRALVARRRGEHREV
ncbi:DNA repair protein RecO [Modicisalibacter tunisiensis]|uniref:DNA repair protein RecO n=1 Tax=Modicisalibacter tunisiensis TaxID=390637 RepID=A0ABS7X170_9GAMM|nr:DNA repair protein RecO [Modicisalibacter tunisiensis]MBZ9568652.1 DNA repair protein RecO [Modicisalibacter tunisiensis]